MSKWSYANAATSTHGTMICTACRKPVESGEYRVRETRDAYKVQHRACSADDPAWAARDSKESRDSRQVFDQLAKQAHYVVVVEFDISDSAVERFGLGPKSGPLVWESYLGQPSTRDAAEARAAALNGTYGRTRIARLVFEDNTNDKQGESQ